MTITFSINYRAEWGQTLCIISDDALLGWTEQTPLCLNCHGSDFWTVTIPVTDFVEDLTYRYAIRLQNSGYIYEAGRMRHTILPTTEKQIVIHDFWQVQDYETVFYSSVFMNALFRRDKHDYSTCQKNNNIRFTIDLPQILPTQGVAIVGNIAELGFWNTDNKVAMSDEHFPLWQTDIQFNNNTDIEYKYVIYDLKTGRVVDMEWGENRSVCGVNNTTLIIENDRCFRRTQPRWRGAGVAIPVFSLRTESSFGIGEFEDLKQLADWAAITGQKIIQTLPVNDTTLVHSNRDSYPYNAVSVFALHPIYLNVEKTGHLTAAEKKRYNKKKADFNAKTIADYQMVYDEKMYYYKSIFKREKDSTFASAEFKSFFDKNHEWLVPYAVFCYLRDKFGTPHFHDWKKYSEFSQKDLAILSSPTAKDYDKVAFHYFIQFHLDKQLTEAVRYARSKGVALKGDIPIGISPDSVDAWMNPQLFNLNTSAGAPPDDFSISGQNWGFPTYNWEVMAKDGFRWWRRRFIKMQDYFDAYRIDHILGFFRIWQMPKSAIWGLCGHFSPAMGYTMQELQQMGITEDENRLVQPYIRSNFVGEIFGEETEYVKQTFLNTDDSYTYRFKEEFDTQQKVRTWFDKLTITEQELKRRILNGLMSLHSEVLFVHDNADNRILHPRIALRQSHSWAELEEYQRNLLCYIHDDYFYHRHNDFWRESAMQKLPTLINSTEMLVCGEDLGMVPACVPEVMHQLQILSLEIQRMPKNSAVTFANPANAPYLSVCTTGTHDMNPIRAWWEENTKRTQYFYQEQLGGFGQAPREMTTEIAYTILSQHMYSPAMWVIFPLQDWLSIDDDLRLNDPHAERINIPDNPCHFWCYRMHLKIEDLLVADSFNEKVRNMVAARE